MIDRTDEAGIAILQMDAPPANVLTTEFAEALSAALADLHADETVGGVVLTGTGSAFSAGVELFRVVDGGDPYVRGLLAAVGDFFGRLRSFPKPMIAAINGHAIAGGAVMACGCDYKVMAEGKGRVGLPELMVGVPFPSVALEMVRSAVPARYHREVMLLGNSYGVEEAVERGFVDEIVPADALLSRAHEVASALATIPPATFSLTKRQWYAADPSTLEPELVEIWAAENTHAHIRGYLERTLGRSSARD